jgi:endo-1,3(4)-beta-glucanase
LTLVAADIAAPTGSASFPQQRVYDPYAQHSWASGYSPFADGNDQESTSEAVNAWNGLGVWARAAGDTALGHEATWLLSNESASALDDSLAPDLSAAAFGKVDMSAFTHPVVSLTWGGKRDHATWFSAAPSAITGIQLIPMAPEADRYLGSRAGGGAAHIRKVIAAATPGGYHVQFGDYLLMYRSLASAHDAAQALVAARELPTTDIDSGNTRSYMLAWIMARTS